MEASHQYFIRVRLNEPTQTAPKAMAMKDCSDLFDDVEWQPLALDTNAQSSAELATHKGAVKVNAFHIRCYKAIDSLTALDIEDIERFFRGCPRCTTPSECSHCNLIDDRDEPRVAVKLQD